MNAIELDAIAHDGKVIVTLPEAYQGQWNGKAVRVIIPASDEPPANPKNLYCLPLRKLKSRDVIPG